MLGDVDGARSWAVNGISQLLVLLFYILGTLNKAFLWAYGTMNMTWGNEGFYKILLRTQMTAVLNGKKKKAG